MTDQNSTQYQKFDSSEGAHPPMLAMTYNNAPAVATHLYAQPCWQRCTPVAVPNSGPDPAVTSSATPTLVANSSDSDGQALRYDYEVDSCFQANNGACQVIGSQQVPTLSQGIDTGWTLPAGLLTAEGASNSYAYRVRAFDGITYGPWTALQSFMVDTSTPTVTYYSPATCGSCANSWTTDGTWSGATGSSGTIDVIGQMLFLSVDGIPDPNYPNGFLGTNGTGYPWTPQSDGPHTLTFTSRNYAGSTSAPLTLQVKIGVAGMSSPRNGDNVVTGVPLAAAATSTYVAARFEYRRSVGTAGSGSTGWATVPSADVTKSDGSTLASWPISFVGGSVSGLTWNISRTLGDIASPVEVRVVPLASDGTPYYGVASTSAPYYVNTASWVNYDPSASTAAHRQVGPGSLNLATGDYQLSAQEGGAFGLSVARVASSRAPAAGVVSATELLPLGYTNQPSMSMSSVGYPGRNCLLISMQAAPNCYSSFGMVANHSYRFTARIYAPAAASNPYGVISIWPNGGTGISSSPPPPLQMPTWVTLTLDMTPTAADLQYGVALVYPDGSGTFDPNGFSLREITAPFGPSWSATNLGPTSDDSYRYLRDTVNSVQVVTVNGESIYFANQGSGKWTPAYGYEAFSLTEDTTSHVFTLANSDDGTTVLFATASSVGPNTTYWVVSSSQGPNVTRYVNRFASDISASTTSSVPARLPWRVVAPSTDGVSGCTSTSLELPAGCRALELDWVPITAVPPTGTSLGDYPMRVRALILHAATAGSSQTVSTVIARYAYDSLGRLRQTWDPRLATPLVTAYTYDSAGRVISATPPGLLSYAFNYGAVGSTDLNAGRLLSISRPTLTPGTANTTNGTAVTSVVYDVPLSGTGAPYVMASSDVAVWGQADVPISSTAVFPPDQVPSSNSGSQASWTRADISYLDKNGWQVNQIAPGGYIATAEYESHGAVTRSLTPANRLLALGSGAANAAELTKLGLSNQSVTARAQVLSTTQTYSADGQQMLDSFEPLHTVVLEGGLSASNGLPALAAGAQTSARLHTHVVYDQGRGIQSSPIRNKPTTQTGAAYVSGYATEADARTTTTTYDWNSGAILSQRTGAASDVSTRVSAVDAYGRVIRSDMPSAVAAGRTNGADSTTTVFYSADNSAPVAACQNKPVWAGLACQAAPAGSIVGGGTNPSQLATESMTYDQYGNSAVLTENANGSSRTTTSTYDLAARPTITSIAGPGQQLPSVTTSYDPATGAVLSTTDGTRTVSTTIDALGRQLTYTDSDGASTSFQYDSLDRLSKSIDMFGSITYTYDTAVDARGVMTSKTDPVAGVISGRYDANGSLSSETLPNATSFADVRDENGQAVQRSWSTAFGSLTETVVPNIFGQWVTHSRSEMSSSQAYAYDSLARLSSVKDTRSGTCTTRTYGFDVNSNRLRATSVAGAAGASCQAAGSPGEIVTASTYDSADRLTVSGYVYDGFGRTTAMPGTSALAYYANDMVYSQTVGANTKVWGLDPAGRIRTAALGAGTPKINHYSGPSDSPSWVDEGTGAKTRYVSGLNGELAVTTAATGSVTVNCTTLHGDVGEMLTVSAATVYDANEFGIPFGSKPRFGWLGAHERSNETPNGAILMGVRLYMPVLGRFLQVDPIPGGGSNAYDYVDQDPVNGFDLSGKIRLDLPKGQVDGPWWTGHFVLRAGRIAIHWNDGPGQRSRIEWDKKNGWHYNKGGVKGHFTVREGLKDYVKYLTRRLGQGASRGGSTLGALARGLAGAGGAGGSSWWMDIDLPIPLPCGLCLVSLPNSHRNDA